MKKQSMSVKRIHVSRCILKRTTEGEAAFIVAIRGSATWTIFWMGWRAYAFSQQVRMQRWLCLRVLTFKVDSVSSVATPT